MTEVEQAQIEALESALRQRAQRLAAEYISAARREREQLLAECQERLRRQEDREMLLARALAERAYRQRVQAAELDSEAQRDRARWQLVIATLDEVRNAFSDLTRDRQRYANVMQQWLEEALSALPSGTLIVSGSESDQSLLKDLAIHNAAPGKALTVSTTALACSGGLMVTSADNTRRVDNTYEGRLERMRDEVVETINARLFDADHCG